MYLTSAFLWFFSVLLFRRISKLSYPQDLLVNLVEISWENWSFGNGEAHYMDA
jgi:hypothetical protein